MGRGGKSSHAVYQYQVFGTSNWLDATIASVGGESYNAALRVEALPGGSTHTLGWNAAQDLGAGVSTNVLLRVRARDITLLGEWSEPMPYSVTPCTDCDGDGLRDDWEIAAFGNLDRDGSGDYDGDGFNDLGEDEAERHELIAANYFHSTNFIQRGNRLARRDE